MGLDKDLIEHTYNIKTKVITTKVTELTTYMKQNFFEFYEILNKAEKAKATIDSPTEIDGKKYFIEKVEDGEGDVNNVLYLLEKNTVFLRPIPHLDKIIEDAVIHSNSTPENPFTNTDNLLCMHKGKVCVLTHYCPE